MSDSRAPRRALRDLWPVGFSGWAVLTAAVVVLYVLLTLGVIFRSPVLTWDTDFLRLDLRHQHPEWKPYIFYYVMFGQRGPATLAFLPFFVWQAWRDRTSRPLVMLVTSLILLNLSVGVVKLATGRLGPRQTHNTHEIFVGGDIYPSGHVSNAVVLYGLIALLSVNHRTLATAAAVFLSVTVGMGTVYLDTHWFSDVVGGWLAGALVLLALPIVMPTAQRWADRFLAWARRRFGRDRSPSGVTLTRGSVPSVRTVRILSTEFGGGHLVPPAQGKKDTPVRSEA